MRATWNGSFYIGFLVLRVKRQFKNVTLRRMEEFAIFSYPESFDAILKRTIGIKM